MKKDFITQCLNTATVLVTAGFPLLSIEKGDFGDPRLKFLFQEEPRLRSILEKYTRQELNLPAHQLLANLRFLKTRLNERSL